MRLTAQHCRLLVQTRQDLHSRHAREQEVLQAQIATLRKASAVASLPDVMKRQALMEVSRLKEENEGLQQRLHAAAADTSAAEAVAKLQVRDLHAACRDLCGALPDPSGRTGALSAAPQRKVRTCCASELLISREQGVSCEVGRGTWSWRIRSRAMVACVSREAFRMSGYVHRFMSRGFHPQSGLHQLVNCVGVALCPRCRGCGLTGRQSRTSESCEPVRRRWAAGAHRDPEG